MLCILRDRRFGDPRSKSTIIGIANVCLRATEFARCDVARAIAVPRARLLSARDRIHDEPGAFDYRAAQRRHGIVPSMNRPGQMNDNAHAESFFCSPKSEFVCGKQFDSDQQLRQTLHTYLRYYNHTAAALVPRAHAASRIRTAHDLTIMCQPKRSKIQVWISRASQDIHKKG
jgi:transposase InsO family protein